MNFLSPFSFKKQLQKLTVTDLIIVKRVKELSQQAYLYIFKDVNIYHHTTSHPLSLLILDSLRGLYLFEVKKWTFDELKDVEVQKAPKQKHSENTLAFENSHKIIHQKFNELTHADGVPIFNFLLMENLSADKYEHLSDLFKKLLPKEKVIFCDSSQEEITIKLQSVAQESSRLPSVDTILGTLFIQYTFLDEENTPHIGTPEQIAFIDKPLSDYSELQGVPASGKSELLLLKAINEVLNKDAQKIIILKPTTLACDLLKKRFLEIIEHAIVEIDLGAIEIITPLTLLNRHRKKMGKEAIERVEIEPKLLKKHYHFADAIFCDDTDILEESFVNYLENLQEHQKILLVKRAKEREQPMLCKSYRGGNRSWHFYQTQPYAKALHIIKKLLSNSEKNILLVADRETREHLQEDLDSFITKKPEVLESKKHLLEQRSSDILLCGYEDINAISVNHIILMDLCSSNENLLEYAINLANCSTSILYNEECAKIENLRSRYGQAR